ncbi:MAG: carboxypeptidase regulatory-like domain-containing protein [Myxococcales bacterium]|nr:carboxypeptidase regulatory-like domain-containing protein [Myxococcales bacterium]
MKKQTSIPALTSVVTALALMGCSGSPGTPADGGTQPGGNTDVKGKVLDALGRGVGDAVVSAGGITAKADYLGAYELKAVPSGAATLRAEADWFNPGEKAIALEAGIPAQEDLPLQAKPLQVLAEDETLAATFAQSFDWTKDKTSVEVVPRPSRAKIDAALYLRNPALYRDTTAQARVTPTPLPSLSGAPQGFDFPIPLGGANAGQQALDTATLVDSLAGTPLTAAEKAAFFVWEPAIKNYLRSWNLDASLTLYYGGLAVESQRWGATPQIPPQSLRRVFLHQREVWVEIVFEKFVDLGAGITDTDGDGRKEVFGRLKAAHVAASAYDRLESDYVGKTFDTLELRDRLSDILDDLYSKTNPTVEGVIGVPYPIPGVGTVKYPFVVLKHAGGAVNVLLVKP